jgi:DDE domain
MVQLWRAVDAEGEVLDVLAQSKRNEGAALRPMRKLLKKCVFVPERLVTDDLRSCGAAVHDLVLKAAMGAGDGCTIAPQFASTDPAAGTENAAKASAQVFAGLKSFVRKWVNVAGAVVEVAVEARSRCQAEGMQLRDRFYLRARGLTNCYCVGH